MADIIVSAQNTLNFNGGAGFFPLMTQGVLSSITFTQTVRQNHIHVTAENTFQFHQNINLNRQVVLSAANSLAFQGTARKAIDVSASSLLSFSQTGKRNIYASAQSSVAFAGLSGNARAHGTYDQLTISQTVSVIKQLHSASASTLVISQAACVYKGNSLQSVIPLPTAVPFTPVILTYGTLSITLKVPLFGNTDSIEISRIQRNSRAGDLIIWAHPNWPKTEKLKFNFVNLSNTQAKAFLAFLDATLGQDITLTDHEGNDWTGFIITPESPITQSGREDKVSCGGFNCEFEFEGVQA